MAGLLQNPQIKNRPISKTGVGRLLKAGGCPVREWTPPPVKGSGSVQSNPPLYLTTASLFLQAPHV